MENQNPVTAVDVYGNEKPTSLLSAAVSIKDVANIESRLEGLEKMKAGLSITPKYREFSKEGESVRGIFVGFQVITSSNPETGEVKNVNTVVWMEADRNLYQNAGTQLVSTFSDAKIPQGTPVQITYEGEKKVAIGKMKVYNVQPLIQE